MKSVWITYNWDDNKNNDIDFIAQELSKSGLDVKLDRFNLSAGKRVWEQIASFIQDPSKSDAWLIYATLESISSEKCKEELAYALDRALDTRGNQFPIIALFPATVDRNIIPAAIKTRLYVNLKDPDWKERIVASIEDKQSNVLRPDIEPYVLIIHQLNGNYGENNYAIEVRPRAGTWSPFVIAVPSVEKGVRLSNLRYGPANNVLHAGGTLQNCGEGFTNDGKWNFVYSGNEASPTQSYYLFCKQLPPSILFGVYGSSTQYILNIGPNSKT